MFGAPNTGAHAYRLGGLAIVDVLLTVVCAVSVSWLTAWKWPVMYTIPGAFLLGILFHKAFCVKTVLNGWLGL